MCYDVCVTKIHRTENYDGANEREDDKTKELDGRSQVYGRFSA